MWPNRLTKRLTGKAFIRKNTPERCFWPRRSAALPRVPAAGRRGGEHDEGGSQVERCGGKYRNGVALQQAVGEARERRSRQRADAGGRVRDPDDARDVAAITDA